MKYTKCSLCDKRIELKDNVFRYSGKLFCSWECLPEWMLNSEEEAYEVKESDCNIEDDAE